MILLETYVLPQQYWLTPLTHGSLVSLLRRFLFAAGYNPQDYTGHSLRKGGATFSAAEHALKSHGDWRSSAFER